MLIEDVLPAFDYRLSATRGKVPVARRIYRLDKLEVGEKDEHNDVILAIFDLGKGEAFAVCTDATNDHPSYRVKASEKDVLEFS